MESSKNNGHIDEEEDEVRVIHSQATEEEQELEDLLHNADATNGDAGLIEPNLFVQATDVGANEVSCNENHMQHKRQHVEMESISTKSLHDQHEIRHAITETSSSSSSLLCNKPADTQAQSSAVQNNSTRPSAGIVEHVPQFHFSHSKAGMENVDKQRMERIIAEVSKGNPYYEQAAKTDARVREKAQALKKKASDLTPKELSVAEFEVNKRVQHLEKYCRDLKRCFVCIDMDQFFVAVEMRDNPKLKGLPVAVGPTLISTASYEARKFGVRSAMPTFIARKLCPQLVVVPSRFEAYGEASKRAQAVFAEYDEGFSAMSLDEAFLDITPMLKGFTLADEEGVQLAEQIVSEMRQKVTAATRGLTCSAGIAPTRMLAKICSEKNKPNGHFVLKADLDMVLNFIRVLPIRKIPGIGKASELLLAEAFDIKTCQDLWDQRYYLKKCLTPALCDFYLRVPIACTGSEGSSATNAAGNVNGKPPPGFFGFVDDEMDEDGYGRKSISIERTFRAINNERELRDKCRLLCDTLAEEIANKNCFGRTLTLKLKTDKFEVRSRGETLKTLFGGKQVTGQFLYQIAEPLLRQELPISARLMGLRISNLAQEAPLNFDTSVYNQPVIDRFLSHPSSSAEEESKQEQPQVEQQKTFCPLCLKDLTRSSNDDVNAHIDACLNRSVVMDIVKSQNMVELPISTNKATATTVTTETSYSKPKIDSYFTRRT